MFVQCLLRSLCVCLLVLHNIISISTKYRYFRYGMISKNIDIGFEVSIYIEKISILVLRFRYISKNIDIGFEVSIYIEKISILILRFRYISKKYRYRFWHFDIYRNNIDIDFEVSVWYRKYRYWFLAFDIYIKISTSFFVSI